MMDRLLLSDFYAFFLCFVKIIGIFIFMPLFSNTAILVQAKAILAALLAYFILPLVSSHLPNTLLMTYPQFLYAAMVEFILGCLLGLCGLFLYSVLDFIGHLMAMMSGLSNAQVLNPTAGIGTELTSNMLIIPASVLLFVGQFHHLILRTIIASYDVIDLYTFENRKDFYTTLMQGMQKMFLLGLQFSFPFVLTGLILNLSLGIVNKLIPQIHIFNILPPAQLFIFFGLLFFTLASLMDGFLIIFSDTFTGLFHQVSLF